MSMKYLSFYDSQLLVANHNLMHPRGMSTSLSGMYLQTYACPYFVIKLPCLMASLIQGKFATERLSFVEALQDHFLH
jgi:hypothetical protein